MKNFSKIISIPKTSKELVLFLCLFIFSYFLFFKNIINPKFNFWNSDAAIKMYPSQVFLHEKLRSYEFPFWTERVFLGYPIYEDMELGFLNPVNLLGNFILGEVNNLKFLHFISYLLGGTSFFYLFSRTENSGLKIFGSTLIFFFSFFPINRLIHLNLVLTYLTIPLILFLAYKYNLTNKFRFLILLSATLAYGILWGHPQTVVLIFIILFLFNLNELGFKKAFKYSILSGLFSICFSLHQLYPSFQAFLQSSRIDTSIKYSDFSNFPGLEFTNIFPYLLGYYQNYKGFEVSGALSYVETYNYIGIVAFVFFLVYLIYGSSDSNFKFVRNLLIVYIVFTFKDFFPFLKDVEIPFYDNFRYWNRSLILIIVAVVFALNHILSKNFNFSKANFKFPMFISLFYIFTYFVGFFVSKNIYVLDYWNFLLSNHMAYLRKVEILVWISLIFLSLVLLFFIRKKQFKLFLILSTSIIFIDFFYFSLDLIPNRISRFDSYKSKTTLEMCFYERCYLENNTINGYEFLMFKTFGPYGYSQFVAQNYKDFYLETFNGDYRKSFRSEVIRDNLNLKFLESLGFKAVLLKDDNVVYLKNSSSFLNQNIFIKSYSEYHHQFELFSDEPKTMNLNLKYSPNWDVTINGQRENLEKDGMFSKINLRSGHNNISINYFPSDIVRGFLIGIFLFSATLLIFCKK